MAIPNPVSSPFAAPALRPDGVSRGCPSLTTNTLLVEPAVAFKTVEPKVSEVLIAAGDVGVAQAIGHDHYWPRSRALPPEAAWPRGRSPSLSSLPRRRHRSTVLVRLMVPNWALAERHPVTRTLPWGVVAIDRLRSLPRRMGTPIPFALPSRRRPSGLTWPRKCFPAPRLVSGDRSERRRAGGVSIEGRSLR